VGLQRSEVSEFEVGSFFFFFKSNWFPTLIIRFANFELAKERVLQIWKLHPIFLFFYFPVLGLLQIRPWEIKEVSKALLGWLSFPSIRPVKRPSKFFIPEVEDDGTGGGRRLMAAATDNPQTICAMMPNLNSGFCLKRFLESSKSVP